MKSKNSYLEDEPGAVPECERICAEDHGEKGRHSAPNRELLPHADLVSLLAHGVIRLDRLLLAHE